MSLATNERLTSYRSLFPHTATSRIYLNHAAVSPMSRIVREAIEQHLQRRSEGAIETMEDDMQAAEALREALSLLINAPSGKRISFQPNTSFALNLIARGLDWQEDDEILVPDVEFPSNVYPWQTIAQERDLKLICIPTQQGRITVDEIAAHSTDQTRLLALSAVQFLSGYYADLEAIGRFCRERDIWFVVDGIQAVGAAELDVQQMNIDALAGGGHKWLMSPLGTGYLYISEKLQDALKRQPIGWLSVEEPWKLFDTEQPLHPDAQRFEFGTPNMSGIHGMLAAIRLLLELGPDSIANRLRQLTGFMLESVSHLPLDPISQKEADRRAGIVSFSLPQSLDPEKLLHRLKEQQIEVAIRQGMLRVAPHFYNTETELSALVSALEPMLGDAS
jgi:cysteine desulfurase/selenocysteine lyase